MWTRRMLGLATLALAAACGPETMEAPPPSIEGLWVTSDDPRYADRAFEINGQFLYLLVGGDSFYVHPIRQVMIEKEELPLYTIDYVGEGEELSTFRFYLSQENGGTILFPNQLHMKWRRDPLAPVPWEVIPPSAPGGS